jgi:hypothetical protein
MCDFSNLDDAAKEAYHRRLTACAEAFGGKNFFLQLLESIRETTPHPLMAKNCEFRFPLGSVKWNKVIFRDKLTLLMKVRASKGGDDNLLPATEEKSYKNVLNLVRTLKPVNFTVKPENPENGKGFTLHPFDVIGEKSTRLNPLFDALFFCSVDSVKKILNYKPKVS